MNEHVSFRCYGARDNRKGAVQQRLSWHQWLLMCMAVAFTVYSPLPSEAVNGESVGGEGVHRTGVCGTDDPDFTISCDDRPEAGVVSCHMRRPAVAPGLAADEGLAVNYCPDARVVSGGTLATFLEKKVTLAATDSGAFVCGQEPGVNSDNLVDFCIVCDTFISAASTGASKCVKIVNEQRPAGPSTCGAFNVSRDPGGVCLSAEQNLQSFFSAPHVGFTIGFDGSDAGKPGAGVGQEAGKDLLVCGDRSWQCIDDRSVEMSLDARLLQEQQLHGLINTPCCMKSGSGTPVCNPLWPKSALCR